MPESHSTPPPTSAQPARPDKPVKPRDDFPLFSHASGQWAKKVRGVMRYFGPWSDPAGAEARWNAEAEDLKAGRTPRATPAAEVDVKALANAFLRHKEELMESGELSPRTFADYEDTLHEIVAAFGRRRKAADLGPTDFAAVRAKLAKRWGPHRMGKTVQTVRSLFKFAFEAGLIDAPQRFGPAFKRPSKKTLRLERAKHGPKLFSRTEVLALIDGALVVGPDGPRLVERPGPALRAMILLAVNAGLGNADLGRLPLSALDLATGRLDYPRVKTGIDRRAWLWPETVAAIREALAVRPAPKDPADAGLVFLTKYGASWAHEPAAVTKEFRKLLDRLGINGHRNFYALRHTFRTVADGAKDQPAADHIMGHEVAHMSSVYREGIADARVRAVCEFVRGWLYGKPVAEAVAPSSASGHRSLDPAE